ncbi:MAG: OmpA family protein [Alphaproteobacteria bacterium]
MKNVISVVSVMRVLSVVGVVGLVGCAGTNNDEYVAFDTPTVDYIEQLDVYSAPHKDSFLNQLAMNYRSYAIYNARTSGYPDMGERFAQKAVAAFSGETPFPESLSDWQIDDEQESYELYTAYNDIMDQFRSDATYSNPELAAEVQAKFDCWLSASASGQNATAEKCRDRYYKSMNALRDCIGGQVVSTQKSEQTIVENVKPVVQEQQYYPETMTMAAMQATSRSRDGVIIVNNVNIPEHLINPVPVQPLTFNQNIYGANKSVKAVDNSVRAMDKSVRGFVANDIDADAGCDCAAQPACDAASAEQGENNVSTTCGDTSVFVAPCDCQNEPIVSEELVSRQEFIDMMMAMRSELAAINARLDKLQAASGDKTMIKVQQIPLEPKQHVMEEIFEVRFDFDKSTIKPEYQALIKQLATATQENKNIKVTVVGHTDTMGSQSYNYALGGRRAEAVQKMLIEYGIPASQIIAVSAGEEDLKVPTPDGVANAENRRVRVVKEVHYTEKANPAPIALEVKEIPGGIVR